jgi:hypothetical protein
MKNATLTLDTAIGAFVFSIACDGSSEGDVSVEMREVAPTPQLPPGYSVQGCRAVVARIRSRAPIPLVRWSCDCRAAKGSPKTGERLDAQEWKAGNHLVTVGTDDGEGLTPRLPFLALGRYDEVTTYSPHRMDVCIPNVPAGFDLTLHFVMAENAWPEPVDASSWYAVDIPHKELLKLAV